MYPTEFPLSPSVLRIVEKLEKDASTSQFLAERARLLLEMSRGGSNPSIAGRLGLHPTGVRNWRNRWSQQLPGLAAFENDPRKLKEEVIKVLKGTRKPPGPRNFTPEQIAAIIALACEPPEKAGVPISHWTAPALAEEAMRRGIVESISHDSVSRFLKSGRAQTAQGQALAHQKATRP
ncbi:Transposase [compost metagenome]